jgi:membrane-bound metal-dependent hydrolase YbcI (DUF457 family)
MPQAIMHVLVPLVLMALIRDWYNSKKGKKALSINYVLIAGLAGLIPDLDVAAYWVLYFSGYSLEEIHRTFAHTIFVPLIFLILFFIFSRLKPIELGKRGLKLHLIFLMFAFGSFIHLVLDAIFISHIVPLYPLSGARIGLNLAGMFPAPLDRLFIPCLETAILVFWLIYLERKHKVSDFI